MSSLALGLLAVAVVAVATGCSLPVATGEDPPLASVQRAAGPVTSAPSPAIPSSAQWPVRPATVLRTFEPHEWFGPGHRGVDLAAQPGQWVRSALPGVVTFAGQVAGRPVVVVRHRDDLRTTYLPVRATVPVGTRVTGGQSIGGLAAAPHCSLTSCLHWGARRADRYIDPLTLVGHQVVLLPP